jgi:hypothetical protein
MDVGIHLIGLLVLVWLLGDLAIVGVALFGARARDRRTARARDIGARPDTPVATLRLASGAGRSSHARRSRGASRLR